MRILLLEDNRTDAELIEYELREFRSDLVLKRVETEEGYVKELLGFSPDLILSDYDLPRYNGALALAEARERCPDIPFILVTGAVSEDRAIEILTSGARDYVLKTRLQQRLVPAVKRALSEAEEHQARKKAEEDLKASERRVREQLEEIQLIYDSAQIGLCVLDRELRYVRINQCLAEMNGIPAADHIGKTPHEIIPDIAPMVEKIAERIFQSGEPALNFELTGVKGSQPDNRGTWIENWQPLKDAEGNVIGINIAVGEITKRKRLEEAVQQQAQLLDLSYDAIFTWDLNGTIEYWNEGAEKLYGYNRDEAVGRISHELLGTRYPISMDAVKAVLMRDGIWSVELTHMAKAGHKVVVESRHQLIQRDGRLIVLETNRDITERKNVEEALLKAHETMEKRVKFRTVELEAAIAVQKKQAKEIRQSEERFRLLVGNVRDYAIFMLDPKGRVETWNEGAECMKGYKAEEIIGEHFSIFYTSEDVAGNMPEKELKTALETGQTEEEGWRVRKDGTSFWASVLTTTLRDGNGELRGFARITRDITERKRAEEALKASEAKFHSLFDHSLDAIFLTIPDGQVTAANRAACEMFGMSEEELCRVGRAGISDPNETRYAAALEERARTGKIHAELSYVRKDGTKFIGEVRSVIMGGDEPQSFVMMRDITERKRMVEDLERHRTHLAQMVEERTAELEAKSISLQELNAALKTLVQQREDDKKDMEEKFVMNVKNLVIPCVEQIKKGRLDSAQRAYLEALETHLAGITTPLLQNMRQFNLTPKEIKVAVLVRQGKSTKQIAKILGIAPGSIDVHRRNIRRKLGLTNKKANLLSLLESFG